MGKCFVLGCGKYCSPQDYLTWHRLPEDPIRCRLWLKLLGRPEEEFNKGQRICADHFRPSQFKEGTLQKKLVEGALPCLNLPSQLDLDNEKEGNDKENETSIASQSENDTIQSKFEDNGGPDMKNEQPHGISSTNSSAVPDPENKKALDISFAMNEKTHKIPVANNSVNKRKFCDRTFSERKFLDDALISQPKRFTRYQSRIQPIMPKRRLSPQLKLSTIQSKFEDNVGPDMKNEKPHERSDTKGSAVPDSENNRALEISVANVSAVSDNQNEKTPVANNSAVHTRNISDEASTIKRYQSEIRPTVTKRRLNRQLKYSCKFPNCKNGYYSYPKGHKHVEQIHFASFPKDPKLHKIWKEICKIPEEVSAKRFFVCRAHFLRSDFHNIHGRRYLQKNVIPLHSKDLPEEHQDLGNDKLISEPPKSLHPVSTKKNKDLTQNIKNILQTPQDCLEHLYCRKQASIFLDHDYCQVPKNVSDLPKSVTEPLGSGSDTRDFQNTVPRFGSVETFPDFQEDIVKIELEIQLDDFPISLSETHTEVGLSGDPQKKNSESLPEVCEKKMGGMLKELGTKCKDLTEREAKMRSINRNTLVKTKLSQLNATVRKERPRYQMRSINQNTLAKTAPDFQDDVVTTVSEIQERVSDLPVSWPGTSLSQDATMVSDLPVSLPGTSLSQDTILVLDFCSDPSKQKSKSMPEVCEKKREGILKELLTKRNDLPERKENIRSIHQNTLVETVPVFQEDVGTTLSEIQQTVSDLPVNLPETILPQDATMVSDLPVTLPETSLLQDTTMVVGFSNDRLKQKSKSMPEVCEKKRGGMLNELLTKRKDLTEMRNINQNTLVKTVPDFQEDVKIVSEIQQSVSDFPLNLPGTSLPEDATIVLGFSDVILKQTGQSFSEVCEKKMVKRKDLTERETKMRSINQNTLPKTAPNFQEDACMRKVKIHQNTLLKTVPNFQDDVCKTVSEIQESVSDFPLNLLGSSLPKDATIIKQKSKSVSEVCEKKMVKRKDLTERETKMRSINQNTLPKTAPNFQEDVCMTVPGIQQCISDLPVSLPGTSLPQDATVLGVPNDPLKEKSQSMPEICEKKSGGMLKVLGIKRKDLTEREEKMRIIYRKTATKLSKLKATIRKERSRYKTLKELYDSGKVKLIEEDLNKVTKDFINSQFRNVNRKPSGKRWTIEDKTFALSLYKSSPKLYHYMENVFELPSIRTLKQTLSSITLEPGLNEPVLEYLRLDVERIHEDDRISVLVFDEMNLSKVGQFEEQKNELCGHEDLGYLGNSAREADEALVFMVRGIRKQWKHIVGYFYLKSTESFLELKNIIPHVISKLEEIGLNIVATVCNQCPNNYAAMTLLSQENIVEPSPYTFRVNGKEICIIYDVPHLLKDTRDCLIDNTIEFEPNKFVKMEHMKAAYKFDQTKRTFKQLLKIRDIHFKKTDPDLKIAAQLLSTSMAGSIETGVCTGNLPAVAINTAFFTHLIDTLFDLLNSNSHNSTDDKINRCAFSEKSPHLEVLSQMLPKLKQWKVYRLDNGNDVTNLFYFIDGWHVTISSIIQIWKKLKDKFSYLPMGSFNKDPLENTFENIRQRGYRNVNPTSFQFAAALKSVLVKDMSDPLAKGSGQPNDCENLSNFARFLEKKIGNKVGLGVP